MTTTELSQPETLFPEVDSHVVELDEVATRLTNGALAHARAKLGGGDVDLADLLGRPDFLEYLKSGLASGVAHALAANDRRVRAVYVYDPALNADGESGEALPLDLTLHLIVLVESPSAALGAFIEALDHRLAESLKALPSRLFAKRDSWLAVSLITERDVRLGLGAAGLLSAVFTPPIKVWECKA